MNRTTFNREGNRVTSNRAKGHSTRGPPKVGALSPMSLAGGVGPTVICSSPQLSACAVGRTLGIQVATTTLVVLKYKTGDRYKRT